MLTFRSIPRPITRLSDTALERIKRSVGIDDSDLDNCFVSELSRVRFHIFDVYTCPSKESEAYVERRLCVGSNALEQLTRFDQTLRTRIISVRAEATGLPLNISFQWMCQIFHQYDIEEAFWEVVCCFGGGPYMGEDGCAHAFTRRYPDGVQSCCYDLQHMDANGRGGPNTWSQRHTGIYHQQVPAHLTGREQPFDLIVALHSSRGTSFSKSIYDISHDPDIPRQALKTAERVLARNIHDKPAKIHELLLETSLAGWRQHIRFLGDGVQKPLDDLFTADSDIKAIGDDTLGFPKILWLRYIRDKVLTATALCHGNQTAIKVLKRDYSEAFKHGTCVFEKRVSDNISGLKSIRDRIDNLIALLEHSIEHKHQELAKESNEKTKELALITLNDSASMRRLTVVGLVYLPGTFVSGLFGMNFFEYKSDTNYTTISKNAWIYVLLWLFLTGLTYVGWRRAELKTQESKNPTKTRRGSKKLMVWRSLDKSAPKLSIPIRLVNVERRIADFTSLIKKPFITDLEEGAV